MKKHKKSKINIAISGVLLICFSFFLVGVITWERNQPGLPVEPEITTKPQLQDTPETQETLPPETVPPTTLPSETAPPDLALKQINFLLIGRDWHRDDENGRSDTMILCSVDADAKTVTMISFLRDIYGSIPGYGSNKLNASYSWGGYELLNDTLEQNFGVRADVSLEIDFDGFENLIDYLGGVDVELTDREAVYLNNHYGWELTKGMNHLNGEQALGYSRIRHLDSDFVRTQRQQNVLISLLHKFRTSSVQEMLNATDEFLDQSTSDHTDEELLDYALELYPLLSDCQVISQRIPADDTYYYDTIDGMSVVVVDFDANRQLLKEWLHTD